MNAKLIIVAALDTLYLCLCRLIKRRTPKSKYVLVTWRVGTEYKLWDRFKRLLNGLQLIAGDGRGYIHFWDFWATSVNLGRHISILAPLKTLIGYQPRTVKNLRDRYFYYLGRELAHEFKVIVIPAEGQAWEQRMIDGVHRARGRIVGIQNTVWKGRVEHFDLMALTGLGFIPLVGNPWFPKVVIGRENTVYPGPKVKNRVLLAPDGTEEETKFFLHMYGIWARTKPDVEYIFRPHPIMASRYPRCGPDVPDFSAEVIYYGRSTVVIDAVLSGIRPIRIRVEGIDPLWFYPVEREDLEHYYAHASNAGEQEFLRLCEKFGEE